MESIKQAITIIDYAIAEGISVSEASFKSGFNRSYVKNVKMRVIDKYDNDSIDEETYNSFMDKYEEYENLQNKTKSNTETDNPENLPLLDEDDKVSFQEKNGVIDIDYRTRASKEDLEDRSKNVGHIKTLDQLLDKCQVDREFWSVKDYTVNKWDVTMKFGSGDGAYAQTYENFQVKARLEKNLMKSDAKVAAELLKEMLDNYEAPVLSVDWADTSNYDEHNLLEINIFDLHIGKLAWAGETGENYDTKIASYRFMTALENLLKRASGFEFSRILFPVGNDFFNSDNLQNTTTRGTPQDEDLRWQKTIKVGNKLIVDGIHLLKQTGLPIDVIVIPGNHDFERTFWLGEVLDAKFHNDDQVNINNGASPRKYYTFGEVLLGFTHGSEEKETSLPLLMATEEKEMWGSTKFHEWHLGHIHRKRQNNYVVLDKGKVINEDLGVTVRYMSSLTGTEEWHHKKGYVGSNKAAEAFIWNDETGLIGHLNTNLTDLDKTL